jgi:hypothetical protein
MSTDGNTAMPLPDSSSSPPAESDIAQHVTDTANSNSWASKVGRAEADFGAAAQQDGDEDMVVTTELVFSGNDAKQDEGQEQGGNANATATADADAVTVAADGDGEEVVAAEFDDCLVGKTLVIRGRPATIVKRDYPLVYWTFDDDADVPPMEKHRYVCACVCRKNNNNCLCVSYRDRVYLFIHSSQELPIGAGHFPGAEEE